MKVSNRRQILKESSAFPLVKFFNYKDWEVKLVTRRDDLKTEKDLYIVINNKYDEMERLGIRLPRIDQALRKARRYVDRLGPAPQPNPISATRQDLIDRGLEIVSIYDLADDVDSALINKMERLGATILLATPYSSRYWYFKDEPSMLRYFDKGGNIGFTNTEKLLEGLNENSNNQMKAKIDWLRKKVGILQNNLDAQNKDMVVVDRGFKGTLEQQLKRYSKMLADLYDSQEYLNYINEPDQLEEDIDKPYFPKQVKQNLLRKTLYDKIEKFTERNHHFCYGGNVIWYIVDKIIDTEISKRNSFKDVLDHPSAFRIDWIADNLIDLYLFDKELLKDENTTDLEKLLISNIMEGNDKLQLTPEMNKFNDLLDQIDKKFNSNENGLGWILDYGTYIERMLDEYDPSNNSKLVRALGHVFKLNNDNPIDTLGEDALVQFANCPKEVQNKIINELEKVLKMNPEDFKLEEAKKKKSNVLKQRAKKHRKHQKGLSPYSYLNPNAGDVEYNINFFNRAMGSEGTSADSACDCAGGGMGESFKKLKENSKGYGITTRTKWRKGNKKPERVEYDLDSARDLKSRLERADGISYIIFDLDTKKEIY